jgi:hypothetical protein
MLVSVTGLPKSGKTHFALTFPNPIKVYGFDTGIPYLIAKFPDKEIDLAEFELPYLDDEEDTWALPIWEKFYAMYKADVAERYYKTLIPDTATNMELVLRQSILEKIRRDESKAGKQKLAVNEYTQRNLVMSAIFERAARAGMNLVVTQYMKEQWQRTGPNSAQPTGKYILDGWNQTEGKADINIEMESQVRADGRVVAVSHIKPSRFNRDLGGIPPVDDLDYEALVALTF